MRTVIGTVVLPANSPFAAGVRALIEIRDVSLADAPSTVIAEQTLRDVTLRPHGQIQFAMPVPEVAPNRRLSVRVHIDVDGSGSVSPGDLLTTTSNPVPPTGTPPPLTILVTVI